MVRKTVSLMAAALLIILSTATPTDAATKRLRDPGIQLTAANDLQRAKLTYAAQRIVYRLKIENVAKAKTQAFARFYRPNYSVMISTKHVKGERRTIARYTDHNTGESRRFSKGVRVRWMYDKNVIKIVNSRFLTGRSARLHAYMVPKDAMHGPYTEPNDSVLALITRG